MNRSLCAVAAALLIPSSLDASSVVGRVYDADGRPLVSVGIELVPLDDRLPDRRFSEKERKLAGTAATDGTFRIQVPGDWPPSEIRISAPGTVTIRPLDVVTPADDLDLGLLMVPPAQTLNGVVRDETGHGIAGARITAFSADSRPEVMPGEALTDAAGRYLISDAPKGVVQMIVTHPGYVSQSAPRTRSSWVLKQGGVIQGVVTGSAGQPVAGARITTEDHMTFSGPRGAFEIGGLWPGIAHVTASDDQGRIARAGVVVVDHHAVAATLVLQPGPVVRGTVRDLSNGQPVPRARVHVRRGSAYALTSRREIIAVSNASGAFQIVGLEPGQYVFEAQHFGYLRAVRSLTVQGAGRPLEMTVFLNREARIEGRVTDDSDRPVAGAHVTVTESNPLQEIVRQLRAGRRDALGTYSDPDGRFVLKGLWPGRALRVEASAGKFVPARTDGIELAAGAVRSNVILRLHAGGLAMGLVTDRADHPLSGVSVYARRIEEADGTSPGPVMLQAARAAAATTDGEGRYVLAGLEPGRYFQTFVLPGYSRAFVPATTVVAGTMNELPRVKLGSAAWIRGRVVDQQQQPVAGVSVLTIDRMLDVRAAISDANGEFAIGDLTEGDEVTVQAESDGAAAGRMNVRVPAAGVTLQLSALLTLRGRVFDTITNQAIRDFSVERIVRAPGTTTFRLGGSAARPFHSDDGTFELERIQSGPCVLRIRSMGYQTAEIGLPVIPPPADIAVPMTRGVSLSGRVVLAGGRQSVPNATITWRRGDAGRGELEAIFASLATAEDTTVTDAEGRFVLDDLPAGAVTLFASHPEYAPTRTRVTLPTRSTVELTMNSGGTVAGTVTLDQGGPAVGAIVAVSAAGERMGMAPPDTATTDTNGRFRIGHLRDGSYTIVARAATGVSSPQTVAIAASEQHENLVLTLTGGTTIHGSVRGLRPEALASIFVMAHGEGYYDSTHTDAAGSFTLPHVPAGTVALEATTSFGQGLSAGTRLEIAEHSPATMEVDIEFAGRSELAGVVRRGGHPVSSVFISATPALPAVTTRGRTNSDNSGSYRIEGLSDGPYQLVFSGPSGLYQRTVDVRGPTRLDVDLPSGSISGTVTDAESHMPVAAVDVTAISGKERTPADIRQTVTDSTGFYTVTDLDPGAYQVRASYTGYQQEVRTLTVGQNEERSDLELHRSSGIRLRIVDGANSAPVSRAAVRLTTRGMIAFAEVITLDNAGRGELPALSPGDYVLTVLAAGYAPRSLSIQAPVAAIDIALQPGGRVQLRLPPAASIRVRLLDAAGLPQAVSGSDPAGWTAVAGPTTVWTNVAAGSYRLQSMTGGETPCVVTAGATSVVDVR